MHSLLSDTLEGWKEIRTCVSPAASFRHFQLKRQQMITGRQIWSLYTVRKKNSKCLRWTNMLGDTKGVTHKTITECHRERAGKGGRTQEMGLGKAKKCSSNTPDKGTSLLPHSFCKDHHSSEKPLGHQVNHEATQNRAFSTTSKTQHLAVPNCSADSYVPSHSETIQNCLTLTPMQSGWLQQTKHVKRAFIKAKIPVLSSSGKHTFSRISHMVYHFLDITHQRNHQNYQEENRLKRHHFSGLTLTLLEDR